MSLLRYHTDRRLQMLRATRIFILSWLAVVIAAAAAAHDCLPRRVGVLVLLYWVDFLLPYEHSTLAELTKDILNTLHVGFSTAAFALFGCRLPLRRAFVVALVAIPLLGLLVRTALDLFGVIVE